jgi:hypothetical protein
MAAFEHKVHELGFFWQMTLFDRVLCFSESKILD